MLPTLPEKNKKSLFYDELDAICYNDLSISILIESTKLHGLLAQVFHVFKCLTFKCVTYLMP